MEKEASKAGGYGLAARVAVLLAGAVASFVLVPAGILSLSMILDAAAGMNRFFMDIINIFIGGPTIVCGIILKLWSHYVQFRFGGGTPMPLIPPQKLVVEGPYAYVRNPMALGSAVYYMGLSVWIGSFFSIVLSLVTAVLILFYIRFFEEAELEGRFGSDYRGYWETVPFIIPRRVGRNVMETQVKQ